MVAARAAEKAGIKIKRSMYQGFLGVGHWAGEEVSILLPQTYMNRSGASVGPACRSLGVLPGDLIVVHDEIDLPYQCLRIKVGGGHGGHNGLRSICSVLGETDFIRLRMGVGRPPAGGDVSAHVLSRFACAERGELASYIDTAAEALQELISSGPQVAMNIFNKRETLT